jgi:hypothetical protein
MLQRNLYLFNVDIPTEGIWSTCKFSFSLSLKWLEVYWRTSELITYWYKVSIFKLELLTLIFKLSQVFLKLYGNMEKLFSISLGGVAVLRSPLTAVVQMGRGADPRLGYFMWVELFVGSLPCHEGFSLGSPVFLPQKSTFLNSKKYGVYLFICLLFRK